MLGRHLSFFVDMFNCFILGCIEKYEFEGSLSVNTVKWVVCMLAKWDGFASFRIHLLLDISFCNYVTIYIRHLFEFVKPSTRGKKAKTILLRITPNVQVV